MIFLIGFMAAGKSSVGRALAGATGRRFVDLDDEIAAMGEPVASLVARDEGEFRRREAAALAHLIETAGDHEETVVATGGGAPMFGDNLATMRAAGLVVALNVDLDEAQRRAAGGPERPLLANAADLWQQRAATYRRAHAVVETTERWIADVLGDVAAVERVYESLPARLRGATILALGDRSYAIPVVEKLADLQPLLGERFQVVTDANVAAHWSLGADPIVLPPGESTKSFAHYEQLCADLVARGLDRGSTIVALGGGVVGDLAGFAAATLFRGVQIVQVPTTLVAMTDAAIGGKTAIDLPAGKNLVGAFHQPRLVGCATETLATLPDRERRAGYGELWKYALLDGRDLWRAVRASLADPAQLRAVIDRAIAYKAQIVSRDERERTGYRALLNLGHTVGHAIESATGLLHGEAVGLGLVAAARVSTALLGAPPALELEVADALAETGLPHDLGPYLTDEILARVGVDKKRSGDSVRFIGIRDVGACQTIAIGITTLPKILRRAPAG